MDIGIACQELFEELTNELVVAVGLKQNSNTIAIWVTNLTDELKDIIPSVYKGYTVETFVTTEFNLHTRDFYKE